MNIFNFRLELTNPFDRWEYFKNLGSISGRLTKHKAWELEHNFYSSMMLDIDIQWNRNSDHAGIHISVGMFGYGIMLRIYDTRHWNYELDKWIAYE